MMKAPSFKTVVGTPEDLKLLSELTAEIHSITDGNDLTTGVWPKDADILYVREGRRRGWDALEELVADSNVHCFLEDDLQFVRFPLAVEMLKLYLKELKQPPFPFKPFDQVLVRETGPGCWWRPAVYGSYSELGFFFAIGVAYGSPLITAYAGNEHLVGTNRAPASGYWKIESGKPTLIRC